MDSAYHRWLEIQEEITYKTDKDDITIQHKAYKGKTHIATIVVWSHKVNKSCMLIWRNNIRTTHLCGSEQEARDLIET